MAQPGAVYDNAGSGVSISGANTLTLKVPPLRAATEASDGATLAASSARPQTSAASETPARRGVTRRSYHGPRETGNESSFQFGRLKRGNSWVATRPSGLRPDTS